MSEKRFPPTEKRLRATRLEGQVAVSPLALRSAIWFGFAAAIVAGASVRAEISSLGRSAFAGDLSIPAALTAARAVMTHLLFPFSIVLVAALLIGFLQTGALFQLGSFGAKQNRTSPEWLGWPLALVLFVLGIALGRELFIHFKIAPPLVAVTNMWSTMRPTVMVALVSFAGFSLCDFVFRRSALLRALAMSREEIEAERSEEQSDPTLRQELRRRFSTSTSIAAVAQLIVVGNDQVFALRKEGANFRLVRRASGAAAASLRATAKRFSVREIVDDELASALSPIPVGELLSERRIRDGRAL